VLPIGLKVLEVQWVVVQTIPINVMNNLRRQKGAPDLGFIDESML